MENIMVSVLCATYNQDKYIEETLESLVRQKTDFNFEIIVHDDASTDKTPFILKKYKEKYPSLVKIITQNENQYSKGVSITREFLLPVAKGKYFAFCEGDDFWIDEYKLQKQVDYMESHPNCSFCTHNSISVDESGKFKEDFITKKSGGVVTTDEVILGMGGFCATNSILAPTILTKNLPNYFDICTMDLVWQMYLASQGETYCFKEKMSAYRIGAIGSWSNAMRKSDIKKRKDFYDKIINVRREFDKDTNYVYHESVDKVIRTIQLKRAVLLKDYKELRTGFYKDIYRNYDIRIKIKIWLLKFTPGLYSIIAEKKGWKNI